LLFWQIVLHLVKPFYEMKIKPAIFLGFLFLFFSCDSSLRIEKRRYMKGYYVASHSDKKSTTAKITDGIKPINTLAALSKSDSAVVQTPEQNIASIAKAQPTKKEAQNKISLSVVNKKESYFSEKVKKTAAITVSKEKTSKNKKNNGLYLLFAIGSLFGFSFWSLSKYKSGMLHKMKFWAFKNKYKSLSIIILAKAYSIIAAFWVGVKLFELDFNFSHYTMHLLIAGAVITAFFEIFRKRTRENIFNFFKNKLPSVFLSIIGVFLCITLGNKVADENSNGINLDRHLNKRCTNYFESKFNFKQEASYSNEIQSPKSNDAGSTALKVFLTILAILSIVVLQALTIAYSCVLACVGADAEAVCLAIFGTLFIAFLAILTFYWISRINLSDEPQT